MRSSLLLVAALVASAAPLAAQQPPAAPAAPRPYGAAPLPTAPRSIERLSKDLLRIGSVRVDLARREVSVPATVNPAAVAEFIANTKGGYKNYESAIEADTNAIDFNLGLILIGLDPDHARHPRFHFDPLPPAGDPVEVWVTWNEAGTERRIRAEELIYDEGSKSTLPHGQWVYTGSVFMPNSTAFVADLDGVLIGFVHTPEPLIERVEPVPGPYGAIKVNPNLKLAPGSPVTLLVRALPVANNTNK